MKNVSVWWAFWIPFILCLIIGMSVHVEKNHNGYITVRQCAEASGPKRVDPFVGEGPECDRYELVTMEESELRSALRGAGEGIVPGLIIGLIAFYTTIRVQKYRSKT